MKCHRILALWVGASLFSFSMSCQARYREALAAAKMASTSNPAIAEGHFKRAVALGAIVQGSVGLAQLKIAQGDFKEAIAHFDKAIKAAPEDVSLRLDLVRALLSSGDRQRALTELRHLADSKPEKQRHAGLMLGALAQSPEEASAALAHLDRMLSTKTITPCLEAAVVRRALLLRLRRQEEAMRPPSDADRTLTDDPEIVNDLITIYRVQGQRDAALGLLRAVVEKYPSASGGWVALLAEEIEQGHTEAAVQVLDRVPAQTRKTPKFRELEGRTWLMAGNPGRAAEVLIPTVEAAMGQPAQMRAERLMLLGRAYAESKQIVEAVRTFQTVLELQPKHSMARLALGALRLRDKKFDKAIECARGVLGVEPKNAKAHELLVAALAANDQNDEARKAADAFVTALPKSADAYAIRGKLAMESGQIDSARTFLVQAITLDPKLTAAFEMYLTLEESQSGYPMVATKGQALAERLNSWLGMLRVGMLHAKHQQPAKAEAVFLRATKLSPQEPEVYKALGIQLMQRNAIKEAVSTFEKRAELAPRDGKALNDLGMLREKLGDKPGAVAAYRKSLEQNPTSFLALNNLAMLLAELQDTMSEAIQLAERAVQLVPKLPAANDTLGWILLHSIKPEDHGRGLGLLEYAARASNDPEHLYHLAVAQHAAGKRKEAVSSLRKALAAPGNFQGRTEAEQLQKKLQAE